MFGVYEEKRYTPQDVVVGIFAHFPEENKIYRSNDNEIKKFFLDNRDSYVVLDNFTFNKIGSEVQSRTLEDVLYYIRPYLIEYCHLEHDEPKERVKNSANLYWKKYAKQEFNEDEIKQIKDLSKKFVERFCD